MGDREYRDFLVTSIKDIKECYLLVGSINDNYFQIPILKTKKNKDMLNKLFGKNFRVANDVNTTVSTIWTVWVLPADRPDSFDGFMDSDKERYIMQPVYM